MLFASQSSVEQERPRDGTTACRSSTPADAATATTATRTGRRVTTARSATGARNRMTLATSPWSTVGTFQATSQKE